MSKVKNLKWTWLAETEAATFGTNLLAGLRPEIIPLGDEEIVFEIEKDYNDYILDFLTDDERISQHVDFWGAPFALTYDIGHVEAMESLCVSGYGMDHGNFFLNDFEVYVSSDKDSLYSAESLVLKYYRSPETEYKVYPTCPRDVLGDLEEVSGRYVGVKFLSSCPQDEITRISRIGVFSRENTARHQISNLYSTANLLKGTTPEIVGEYIGNPQDLTSDRIFFEDETVSAISDIEIKLQPRTANKLFVVGTEFEVISLSCDGADISYTENVEDTYNGRKIHTLSFNEVGGSEFLLKLKKGAVIDSVFTDSDVRLCDVNTSSVLDSNFIGAGANAFPNAFSEYALREGYNEVYWELEKHHIQKSRPHCIRMWFQIDWVVDTEEQYKNGDWQFDNQQMDSVVKYCEAFRDQGVEVELDFGWKVGTKVMNWFSIGGVDQEHKHCAAPKDLYNYGKAAAATLEYLILEKGCDNVKYISFYNEVSGECDRGDYYDFAMYGEAVAYWASMARYAKYFIDHSKVKGMVDVWGAEQCVFHEDVMEKMNILCHDLFTIHSVHKYSLTYKEVCHWGDNIFAPNADGKQVVLTEFGNSSRVSANWYANTVNTVLAGANHGISGGFIWVMAGSPLVDPLNWMHAPGACDASYEMWDFFPISKTLDEVGESFYELSLINHYVPFHSKVYEVSSPGYNDVRYNAFYKDGEYTLVVESKGDKVTGVEINLDREINRKLYRHTYRQHDKGEGNMIVPPVDKVLEVGSTIKDTLDEGYALYVYTTIPPIRQVVMDKVDIHAAAGDRVKIGATVLDDNTNGSLTFSISKSLIEGAAIEGGEVVIPATAKSGEMLSVKAELPTGEYGISIIRID